MIFAALLLGCFGSNRRESRRVCINLFISYEEIFTVNDISSILPSFFEDDFETF